MIGQLRGEAVGKDERALTIDVGGVGYRVYLTTDTLAKIKIGQSLTLRTHLAVRENALDLYGFETAEALEYFELLITVPGIGPRSALAILSLASPEILRRAVSAEDTAYLTRVSGIGKKSAEKIVLTLKDKLAPGQAGVRPDGPDLAAETEALEALKALGYSTAEGRGALKKAVSRGNDAGAETANVGELVKAALKNLSGQN